MSSAATLSAPALAASFAATLSALALTASLISLPLLLPIVGPDASEALPFPPPSPPFPSPCSSSQLAARSMSSLCD